MNLDNLKISWQDILSNTQALEEFAVKEEWDKVAEIAKKRHKAITIHFSDYPVGPKTADFYQRHLGQFLIKEEQLQQLATNARKLSMRASLQLTNNKKAVNAYREV